MNILIVEDEYKELLFLTNFVRRIFPDMAIVGAVNNGKAALEAGHLHAIDLALLDIELPVHDGLYVAEQLKKKQPGPSHHHSHRLQHLPVCPESPSHRGKRLPGKALSGRRIRGHYP